MSREVRISAGGVYDLGYHVVSCPKYRRPVLSGPVKDRCEVLIRAKTAEHSRRIVALEIMPYNVHLFVKAHLSDSHARIANRFKGSTPRILRREFPHLRSRLPTLWSRSCQCHALVHMARLRTSATSRKADVTRPVE